ALKV
ncbi:arginine/agmatine antiporter, partial [Vibrio parahaemolyticus V-223/04]